MSESVHHIRLLAGLEIKPGSSMQRHLERDQAEQLAGHLAADLQSVVAAVDRAMLVLGGCLFEPFELIRPGFPIWQALEELAATTLRERGFEPRILAIGAHRNKMPHSTLQPPDQPPQGQFLVLPMTLICNEDDAQELRNAFEAELFERGSIDPPARALLSKACGVETVHGQLLTLADLIALQHVQLDSAGLGGFWPVVEQILVDDTQAQTHALPAGLEARWEPTSATVNITFISLHQHGGELSDYTLWLRSLRTLTTLLDTHGVDWCANAKAPLVFDPDGPSMIESAGPSQHPNGITAHRHPDIGLLAWTVVEDGRMMHIYPLRPQAAERIGQDMAARGLPRFDQRQQIHIDPESGQLRPASQ